MSSRSYKQTILYFFLYIHIYYETNLYSIQTSSECLNWRCWVICVRVGRMDNLWVRLGDLRVRVGRMGDISVRLCDPHVRVERMGNLWVNWVACVLGWEGWPVSYTELGRVVRELGWVTHVLGQVVRELGWVTRVFGWETCVLSWVTRELGWVVH